MKKVGIILAVLLLLGAGGVYLYFKFQNKALLKYVPKDAFFVAQMDFLSIGQKINFNELAEFKIYKSLLKEMNNDTKSSVESMMEKPTESGLAFTTAPIVFGYNRTKDDYKPLFCIAFGISDKEKFTKFFKNITEDKYDIQKGDPFTTIRLDNEASLLFNEKVAFLIGGEDEDDVSYKKEAEKLTQLKKDQTIESQETFQNFIKNKSDISLFINKKPIEKAIDLYGKTTTDEIELINAFLKTYPYGMTLNFNQDAITLQTFSDPSNDNESNFIKKSGMSSSGLKYLAPTGKPLGFLSMNLDLSKIRSLLTSSSDEMKEALREISEELNLSEERLFEMFTGEISLSMADIVSMPVNNQMGFEGEEFLDESNSFNETEPIPAFVAYAKLANSNDFEQVLNTVSAELFMEDGLYKIVYDQYNDRSVFFVRRNNDLLISNNKEYLIDFEKGKHNWRQLTDETVTQNFSNFPICFYMDMKYGTYENFFNQQAANSFRSQELELVKIWMKNLKSLQGTLNKEGSTLELKMTEKNMNSLWRLFLLAEETYKKQLG